jgi:endoglucanase
LRFYVDPTEEAYQQWEHYKRQGKTHDAALIWKLASQPRFRWFGKFTRGGAGLTGKVRKFIGCAEASGAVPLMVVLRAQGKACNPHYTAGGAPEDARTRSWYKNFAKAVGSSRVVIAFEPDSLGTVDCLARSRRHARLQTLRSGVDALSKLPNATVYLEGGASDWEPAKRTARMLRFIGIRKVRGFMLNVTHYAWTSDNIRYGRRVSRLVGGKPFIVSTSYNGRGPIHYWLGRPHRSALINVYCNPQRRGLGPSPTTQTGYAKVDAFMWINRPGISGAGGCNGAPAHVGTWWPARALMFAQYATNWVRAPRGTHFGFRGHVSLCSLGAPRLGHVYSRVAPKHRCGH